MPVNKFFNRLEQNKVLRIEETDLQELLKSTILLQEVDTIINDYIRILDLSGTLIFQETDNKGNILIRKIESLNIGNEIIESRKKIYENMWNGCGCKINYYE